MSTIPQNQAVAEGILTLTNDENTTPGSGTGNGVYYYDIFGIRRYRPLTDYDLRSSKNSITYQVFRAPVSPHITLYQGGEEVSSITVSQEAFYATNIEVVSSHPVSVSRSLFSGQGELTFGPSFNNTQSFNFIIGQPRVEGDGNYHYTLTVIPTMNNPNESDPIKLGDLSFTSRIYKNGTRPKEWVVVDDNTVGLEIVKTLLRIDTAPTIINLNEDINPGQLPDINNAPLGTVYRGTLAYVDPSIYYPVYYLGINGTSITVGNIGTTSKLFVAVPYGLTKESYNSGDIDYIESDNRYYYSQTEIDNTFGQASRVISVIQSGDYNYSISGNRTTDLDFLGETREYELTITPENMASISDFVIGSEENCEVTKNGNTITMSVPSRIPSYFPRLITDPYYLDLTSLLPVSFNVMVNRVQQRQVSQIMGLGNLNSAIHTSLHLGNEPTSGTSGLDVEPENIYYEDWISGIYKYVRNLETYGETGYTHKTNLSWSSGSISQADFNRTVLERNRKYGLPDNTSWVPCLVAPSSISSPTLAALNELPRNSDDIVFVGYYVLDTSPTSPRNMIEVDSLPLIGKSGYTYKVGSSKYILTLQGGGLGYPCYTSSPEWLNSSDNENLYNDSGLAKNGYYWDIRAGFVIGVNRSPVLTSHPPANSGTFGTTHYLWEHATSDPLVPGNTVVERDSLPETRNEVNTTYTYHISGTSDYYWLPIISSLFVCKVKPVYSIVALSDAPPNYSSTVSYLRGDKTVYGDSVYESLVSGNLGETPGNDITKWKELGDIFDIDSLGYKYYNISKLPYASRGISSSSVLPSPTIGSAEYVKLESSGRFSYFRKGPCFLVSNPSAIGNIKDYGLYISDVSDPLNPINTIKEGRYFKKGSTYYRLISFAPELALPNKFYDPNLSDKLNNSDYPGNIILKGDDSESGFGGDTEIVLGGTYYIDFNDYTVKSQSFSERVDLRQKRITKGIVSNFGTLDSSGSPSSPAEYKLYLGEDEQNIIELSIGPDITEVKGMIGVYSLSNVLSPTSNRVGQEPRLTVSGNRAHDSYTLTTPRLDGGSTENFIVEFDRNDGDSSITREYMFSYSEDGLDSLVTLRIIQSAYPGEVRLDTRRLYFLGNGLLNSSSNFGFLYFSSDIRRNNNILSIDNIEVLSDMGEDLLDRTPETGSYLEAISLSPTYVNYKAFLKLKPNTRDHNLEGFRIKIGKRNGGIITDRTLDDETAEFWKYTDSGWVLLGSDYVPTYTEPYFQTLPAETNLGGIVCVCNSLRGWQGSYSVSLFRPGTTNFDNPVELEWRSTMDLQDIIDDFNLNTNAANPLITPADITGIITNTTTLPDIKTIKTVGLIYQIGNTYYYSYSDFITSDYTFGTLDFPVALGTGREGQQKYHMKIVQSEYDTSGNISVTPLTNTFFTYAGNYDLLDTSWELYNTSGALIGNINVSETCFVRAVYSDVQNPYLVPYLETSYSFSDDASDIIIKGDIKLKVKYNSGNISMDSEYKEIENTYTIYMKRKWNIS